MHSVIQQVELIDFYLHKIEFYFSKKQSEDSENQVIDELSKRVKEDERDDYDIDSKAAMSSIQEDDWEDQDE